MSMFRKRHKCPSCGARGRLPGWSAWEDFWVEQETGLPGFEANMYHHKYTQLIQVRHCLNENCNHADARMAYMIPVPVEHEWKVRRAADLDAAKLKVRRY